MKLSLYLENKNTHTSRLCFESDGKNHKFHNMGLQSSLLQSGIRVPASHKSEYHERSIIRIDDSELFLDAFRKIYTEQVLNKNSPYSENIYRWVEEN